MQLCIVYSNTNLSLRIIDADIMLTETKRRNISVVIGTYSYYTQ